jgi:hypothetical protein
MSAADGPAFLAAAVSAAIRAKAPRRTVQAVASAVAGVFARPATARAAPRMRATEPAGAQSNAGKEESDPVELLHTLRAARAAQRRRKKERRKAAKAAAVTQPSLSPEGAAGHGVDSGEVPTLAPALAPRPSAAEIPAVSSADGGQDGNDGGSYAPSIAGPRSPPSSTGGVPPNAHRSRPYPPAAGASSGHGNQARGDRRRDR